MTGGFAKMTAIDMQDNAEVASAYVKHDRNHLVSVEEPLDIRTYYGHGSERESSAGGLGEAYSMFKNRQPQYDQLAKSGS